MKNTIEQARQLFGAVLASPEPKRLIDGAGIAAKQLGDDLLAVGWELAAELAARGDRVNAMTVFMLGSTRHRMRDDDLPVLQALESRSTINADTFIQVARQFRTYVHGQTLAAALDELAKALRGGVEPGRAQGRFEAIRQAYHRLHAQGLRGDEVIALAMDEFDQRKTENRELYLKLGIPVLDEVTGGAPPKYCMFLGPPSAMKSGVMATSLERRVELYGARPLVISLEDGATWPFKRLLAKRTGMKLRDVFNKEFPDGAAAADELSKLSQQFIASWFLTKDHVRTPEDIVAECWRHLAQHGITEVWLDNARHVKNETRRFEQPRHAVMRMHELFADFSERSRLPFFLMIHTSREYEKRTNGNGPPIMSDVQESAAAEADVRFMLGLWEKNGCTRATVLKHTEGVRNVTVELDRLVDSALIDPDSGRVVNLLEEERKDREEEKNRGDASAVARSFRRKNLAKQYVDQHPEFAPKPKAKKPEAQATLPLAPAATPAPEGKS